MLSGRCDVSIDPTKQRTLSKLPPELRRRNSLSPSPDGACKSTPKRAKTWYATCTRSDRASILHATVGGWVGPVDDHPSSSYCQSVHAVGSAPAKLSRSPDPTKHLQFYLLLQVCKLLFFFFSSFIIRHESSPTPEKKKKKLFRQEQIFVLFLQSGSINKTKKKKKSEMIVGKSSLGKSRHPSGSTTKTNKRKKKEDNLRNWLLRSCLLFNVRKFAFFFF